MKIEVVHPKVYLDISISNNKIGRVVVELYPDLAPKAVENFIHLCKGDIVKDGKPVTLKGNHFHRAIRNFMIQAGDLQFGSSNYDKNQVGKGETLISSKDSSDSILEQDDKSLKFDTIHNIALSHPGSNSNNSQFFINTYPCPHLNGKHTIFGKVIKGKSTIRTIEYSKVDEQNIPINDIIITDCGEWDETLPIPVYNASYNSIEGDVFEEFPDDEESFDKDKPIESFKAIEIIKNSGSTLFKSKTFNEAFFKYQKALRYVNELIPDKDSEPELAPKFEDTKRKLYSNLALTCNNLHNHTKAIDYATYLLENDDLIETEKAKGFYRRGIAKLALGKYPNALEDLKSCAKYNPKDKVVVKKIEETEKFIEDQKNREKQKYAKFFGK